MPTTAADLRSPLTVGFIGAGFMATVHSRAARASRARLLAISAGRPGSAERAAHELGIERAEASAAAVIDAVDLVHVVTPNASHAEYAHAALAAGRHVICEKPLATTADAARELVAAAEAAGVVAAVPFVYRYHPMVREARARIASGRGGGRVLSIQGSYLQDWLALDSDDDWRVDPAIGGASRAFADIGSHLCDLVEFVTGDRITRLAATTRTYIAERGGSSVDTEDAAALVIETAGGAIGTLLVSQAAPGRKNRLALEIAGSAESIGFDQENPETLWLGRRTGSRQLLRDGADLSPDAARLSVLPAGHPLGYQDAFTAFVTDVYDAVGGSRPEGLPTFADGLRAAQLTEAVLRSSELGAWVDAAPALADHTAAHAAPLAGAAS